VRRLLLAAVISMPLIKRYPNRKLYDTEAKRYVTLDDIASMIRAEREVRVIDNESGEDVTSLTLTQIILEQEKKSSGYLSSWVLTSLIRSGGATLESWRQSVERGVASLSSIGRTQRQSVEEQIAKLIDQGKLTVEQAQGLLKLDGVLSELLHSLNVPTHSDIRSLQDQIEILSERLSTLAVESRPAADPAPAPPAPMDPEPNGADKTTRSRARK
jgi:polyhydroxyalkanoate synthesis repressor PhaR